MTSQKNSNEYTWQKIKGKRVPVEVALARVRERHIVGGCDQRTADEKVETNDRPNSQVVAATRHRADRVISV